MNDLAAHIQAARLIDTHEHLRDERAFIEHGPDVLQDLFDNYARHTVPANKVFAFGGDTSWPAAAVAAGDN
jgi:hypothetical protein